VHDDTGITATEDTKLTVRSVADRHGNADHDGERDGGRDNRHPAGQAIPTACRSVLRRGRRPGPAHVGCHRTSPSSVAAPVVSDRLLSLVVSAHLVARS
jgi:hypothetical protein